MATVLLHCRMAPRTLAPFHIGGIRIDPPFFLAPLAGLTDRAFREMMARRGGSGLYITEMVSAEGMLRNPHRAQEYAGYTERQRPISCQIEGCDPARMAEAALAVQEMGMNIVDVNVGCPAPKITKGGAGSALLKEPQKVGEIIRAMTAAVDIPVTVKIRIGWDEQHINAVETARAAEAGGAAAVIVHGRTRTQEFRGEADWSVIAEVVRSVKIPVIGNGDVTTPEILVRRFEESGCAGIMVGRGAVANPWIFEQARALYETGSYATPTLEERGRFVLDHFEEMLLDHASHGSPLLTCKKFRAYMAYYTVGVVNGKHLRVAVNHIEDADEMRRAVEAFLFGGTCPGEGFGGTAEETAKTEAA